MCCLFAFSLQSCFPLSWNSGRIVMLQIDVLSSSLDNLYGTSFKQQVWLKSEPRCFYLLLLSTCALPWFHQRLSLVINILLDLIYSYCLKSLLKCYKIELDWFASDESNRQYVWFTVYWTLAYSHFSPLVETQAGLLCFKLMFCPPL